MCPECGVPLSETSLGGDVSSCHQCSTDITAKKKHVHACMLLKTERGRMESPEQAWRSGCLGVGFGGGFWRGRSRPGKGPEGGSGGAECIIIFTIKMLMRIYVYVFTQSISPLSVLHLLLK